MKLFIKIIALAVNLVVFAVPALAAKIWVNPDNEGGYTVQFGQPRQEDSLDSYPNDDNEADRYRPMSPGHRSYYRWVDYEGFMPPRAVVGGREPKRLLYICQASYRGGVHPGKIVANNCNITYGGQEIPRPEFRILVGKNLLWLPASNGYAPRNAVVGGFENDHRLFICRARYQDGVHPGKIVSNWCNIGYAGKEILRPNYEVLVAR